MPNCIYWLIRPLWLIGFLAAACAAVAEPAEHLGQRYTPQALQAEVLLGVPHMSLAEARAETAWQPFKAEHSNQGISNKSFWLRFTLTNTGAEPKVQILSTETSYLDHLVVYQKNADNADFSRIPLSDRVPFTERPLYYRTLATPVIVPPYSHSDIYLEAYNEKADSVTLGFTVESPAAFGARQQREHLAFGIFYGAHGIMVIMALIFAISLRQRNAAYYALFLISSILFWLMLNGVGFQYLWPNWVWWHNEGFHFVYLLFTLCALQFSKGFLQLRQFAPSIYHFFTLLQGIALLGIGLRLFGFYETVLALTFTLLMALAFIIPAASALVWRRGLDYAFWSLLAWLIYALGLILSIVSASSSLLSWGMKPLYYVQVAALLEILFLMIGLSKWLIHLELDRQRALTLANEDPLTGLGNRRQLQLAFNQLRNSMPLDSRPVYLLMIDLDHFKAINDSYGHDAGDKVLREIGVLLRRICRESDVVTRFGGEEFAVLLRAPDVQTVYTIAERIRKEFAMAPTTYDEHQIAHTLCCGIAEVLSPEQQPTVQEMMRHADEALYQAKAAGRNQCHIYQN